MIKPNRTFVCYQNENPIYKFYQKLKNDYSNYLSLWCCPGMSVEEYISFITFEMISQRYEDESETMSLRQHQRELIEKEKGESSPSDVLEREKERSKDLRLRREFREAKLKRFNISDDPRYEQLHQGMKDRVAPKEGYNLTKIQSFQLEDKLDFQITKAHRLISFADSKNTRSSDIIDFYKEILTKKSMEHSEATSLEDRIIYAINLNKFENENLYSICYRIARYCFDNKIKIVAENLENSLLALTGAICCGPIQIHKKPVLLIEKLLPACINSSIADSRRAYENYAMLQFEGMKLRKDSSLLSGIQYTLEDFWEFIYYNYNVFDLYQNIRWDGKGQTISNLRKVIKIVAIKPLD